MSKSHVLNLNSTALLAGSKCGNVCMLRKHFSNGKSQSVVRWTLMWINRVIWCMTVTVLVNKHMLVWMWQHVHVWSNVFMPVCVLMWMYVKPTFLTVMFVLMQYKAMATLTNVRAHCVDALVLAAAVVLAALIFVCERYTCNTSLMWRQQKRRGWREARGQAGERSGRMRP